LYPPKLLYVDKMWLIKNQAFIDFYLQKMERDGRDLYDIKKITKITIYPKKLEMIQNYGTMTLELV